MNLLQKVERLLHDKYRYHKYYCSALLTLVGMVRVSLTHRIDQLSHHTVGQLDELHRLLVEAEPKLTDRLKSYEELSKVLRQIYAVVRDIVRGLADKKIVDSSKRLFAYFYSLSDPGHPVYPRLDALSNGKESMTSSVSTSIPSTNLKINNEVALLFWEKDLSGSTVAFVEDIPDKLLKFLHKYQLYTPLLSQLYPRTLVCMLDPHRQHLVSPNNLSELFKQLCCTNVVEGIMDESTCQSIQTPPIHRLETNLRLKFRNKLEVKSNLHDGDIIELNVDRVILNDGKTLTNKHSGVTVFGSSTNNEVQIKHKWISRVQFIIISDPIEGGYFVVCASASNSTSLVRTQPTTLTQEMLIKIGPSNLFNIYKIQHLEEQRMPTINDSDKTVTHMPTSSDKTVVLQLTVEILTGKYKDKFVVLRHQVGFSKLTYRFGPAPDDDIFCEQGATLTVINGACFEISSGAEILLKTSSQRNSQRPSRRHRLHRSDRVYFDECEFEVLNDV